MDTKDIIIKIFSDTDNFQYEKSKNEKIKNLGISSITFLNIVIKTCKELGIDFMQLKNSTISTENSIEEYIASFDSFLVKE
jgi:acyl carrier protein